MSNDENNERISLERDLEINLLADRMIEVLEQNHDLLGGVNPIYRDVLHKAIMLGYRLGQLDEVNRQIADARAALGIGEETAGNT